MNLPIDDLKRVRDLIEKSHLVIKKDAVLEFYHHQGVEHFKETGAVFINIINKEYCKSCAVLLPGQVYPDHFHKIKIETFFILYGDLTVCCEGEVKAIEQGDIMSIERGQSHSFSSVNGAVFEELSTTYVNNDSVYANEEIRNSTYDQRKTSIPFDKFKEMVMSDA